MAGILYLVATPIGNLGDFSPRAAETLAQADFIAAEDTRVSVKLLNHFDIKKPLVSYHEHNRAAAGQAILERLLSGETCALVTDAGTPAISDPGQELVALCAENGVTVQAIPGCEARNVDFMMQNGYARTADTVEDLVTLVCALLNDTKTLEHITARLRADFSQQGAEKIVNYCQQYLCDCVS